jgi:hypothetical protein
MRNRPLERLLEVTYEHRKRISEHKLVSRSTHKCRDKLGSHCSSYIELFPLPLLPDLGGNVGNGKVDDCSEGLRQVRMAD